MKIERLRRFNLWKVMTVLLVVSVIGLVITLKVTQAKYRYTSSIPIVSGTIHYKTGDVSVLAINLEQDDGTYTESEDFPTSGYSLNTTESYCARSVDGEMITQEVDMSYTRNTFTVTGLTKKGTKCFLYLDKYVPNGTFAEILASNYYTIDTSRSSGSFTSIFKDDTAGTISIGTDDYGTTYFFAGKNPSNWVKFAGFYWRIIRINGDGSIRLIYNGSDTTTTGTTTQLDSTSKFNSTRTDNMYVGYMYTSGSVHGLGTSSTIKGVLDSWYTSNLSSYASYIDTNAGFCGDRQPSTSSSSLNGSGGTGTTTTYYAGYIRAYSTHQFTYKCAETSDLYTVSSSSYGNKALTYPIGLITMDEAAYAGGYPGTANSSFWLYTNQTYWTLSPSAADSGSYAYVFSVTSSGNLYDVGSVASTYGVRPVINLKSSITFTGTGTSSDPFTVS